ncbi:MAG TPA: energy transducer TonB [Holophaga sp.]|nr:energy transducer TonB [Holophaga sp.]
MSRPGPGPAEGLPPTLTPHAVALAAPRPERAASLLTALAIYALLGGGFAFAARRVSHRPIAQGRPPVEWKIVEEEEAARPRPEPVRPPAPAGPRPAGFQVVQPRLDDNVIPERVEPLDHLEDRSHQVAGDPSAPVGPAIPGLPVGPVTPEPPRGTLATGPIEIPTSAVTVLTRVDPVYPSLAKLVKAQGPVELRLTIDEQGVPMEVEALSGPHPLLVAEAARVARLWRFRPATAAGSPVQATFRLTVTFRLAR